MADLPPPLGALRFEQVARERRNGNGDGQQQSSVDDRRAVCARSVSPGSLLLPAGLLPFEAVLTEPAGLLERCSGSFSLPEEGEDEGAPRKPLMRCSRCKVARYSSADAQRGDWKGRRARATSGGLHSRECAALRALAESAPGGPNNKVPPASIRLAARVFWKQAALLEEEKAAEATGNGREEEAWEEGGDSWWSSAEAVATLRHHFSELPDDRKVSIAAAAAAARSFMFGALTDEERRRAGAEAEAEAEAEEEGGQASSSPPPTTLSQLLLPPPRRLAELLSALSCNAHALSDASQGTLQPYGVGLYPAAAMLNHSCWPTAAVVFRPGAGAASGSSENDGRRLEARALRRLAEGEEATISYVDLCCPRPERRKALLEGYSFDIDARLKSEQDERDEQDSPVVARWQGRVTFPPGSSPAETSYRVSAALHEARPTAATEDDSEEATKRRLPLESIVVDGEVVEGSGGVAWIEEEEEEEEEGEETSESGQRRRRRKTVKVLAWGRSAFPADPDPTPALASYSATSASAALAAALSSEALAAKEGTRALSLAKAGREALLRAAAEKPHLPCPSPSSSSYVAARLDDALTHAAIQCGEIKCALEAARRAVPTLYLLCSPKGHPPRAFAVATLAKLESAALGNGVSAERVRRAAEVAQQAAEELGVCFPGSEREREFKVMAEGLRAEVGAAQRMLV